VVLLAASLRYDDGKTLKGIGTRASKSRLTILQGERILLECLSTRRKEDKKGDSCFSGKRRGEGGRERVDTPLLSRSLQSKEMWGFKVEWMMFRCFDVGMCDVKRRRESEQRRVQLE
jgi:hypothetical protein